MPEIETNVLLSDKTMAGYQIGGIADYYVSVLNLSELKESVEFAKEKNIPFFILGNGSNLLVSDKGYRGLVICTKRMDGVFVSGNTIKAEAGATISALVREAILAELSGMEELSGIPGTVGGAVVMNAGAFSQTISDYIAQICYYDCDLESEVVVSKENAEFEYRTSIFRKKNSIILWAEFLIPIKVKFGILVARQNEILEKRKIKQPLEYHSCGSIFKRPQNGFAGKLIEQSGLKGLSKGGAEVSVKHANFIVNKGSATAEDVRSVIASVRETVKEKHQVLLEPEVVFLGEFDTQI